MARVFQLKSSAPSRLGIDYQTALNDEQRAVVMAGAGPLLVLAGAGSGKTRALTYRVARLIDQGTLPERIMLLTFTNRSAKQMLDRVAALVGPESQRVVGGTFHHVGNAILRRHAEAIGYGQNFTILDRDDAREVMAAAMVDTHVDVSKGRFPKPDVLLDIASTTINTQQPAREVLLHKAPRFVHLADEITAVCRAFVTRKASMNLMDFDDLLMNWKVLLEEGGPLAALIKSQFGVILVDEYQDTNILQGQIVDLMAAEHQNITAVGDDAQCIYGFRGAEVKNMLEFQRRYPAAKLLPLAVNYRSTPQILSLANHCLQRSREGFKTRLLAVRKEGSQPALVPCRDAHQQAAFVAERVLQLRDEGVPLDDIAVLYRAHRNVLELQVELTRRGIPFLVRSGLRFFEQAHIKDVIAHLKLLFNPDDELSFRRCVKLHDGVGNATSDALWRAFRAMVGQGKDVAVAAKALAQDPALDGTAGRRAKGGVITFTQVMQDLCSQGVRDKPGEQIRVLLDRFYGDVLMRAYPNGKERQAEIEELADYAGGFADTEAFLSELSLVQSFSAEEVVAAETPDEKLTLSSVHQAKGLEWSRVFVVWASEGTLPSDLALKDPGGEDEERRLFYVAVTRAKDELYLTHPLTSHGRDHSMVLHRRSRFIEEMPAPGVDENGILTGLYEEWQIEVVAADQLPPASSAGSLDAGGGAATGAQADDDSDSLVLDEDERRLLES